MKRQAFVKIILGLLGAGLLVPVALGYPHYRSDLDAATRRIRSGSRVIQTACGPIEYSEFGEGVPVLMVHGAGGGYDQGELTARLIGGNFRWISVSRFGYLRTPMPEGADSSLQADAHACLLDALGIERLPVVAVSAGGPSSLQFALRHPERITALVMISAVSHPTPPGPASLNLVLEGFRSDLIYWWLVHAQRSTVLSTLGLPRDVQVELSPRQQAVLTDLLDGMLPMSARRVGLTFDMTRLVGSQPYPLDQIHVPTLVVHARDDTLVAFDHGQFTADGIPGAEFMALDRGGHFVGVIDASVQAKVLAFLEQYPRLAAGLAARR